MKNGKRTVLPAAAAVLAVGGALGTAAAAGGAAASDNPKFVKLDKNRDGFLTVDEVRHMREYPKALAQADGNRDGKLDPAEFIKAEAIHERMVAGKYVDDSVITAKVKAALLKEPQLKSLDVSVETLNGEVLLSGFVHDDEQRRRAMKAASAVGGVTAVRDGLLVR